MKLLPLLAILFCSLQVIGQTHYLSGTVTDSATHEPLRNASIYNKIEKRGTRTDSLGKFTLPVGPGKTTLVISMIGYNPATINLPASRPATAPQSPATAPQSPATAPQNPNPPLTSAQNPTPATPNPSQPAITPPQPALKISLSPQINKLDQVIVTNKHGKYRNKENPAVELIRKVIANKEANRPESFDYATYEEYDKVELSLRDLDPKKLDKKMLRPYKFLFSHPDTLIQPGDTSVLYPVYLEEKLSDNYLQKKPARSKQIVTGEKKVNFGDLVDAKGISDYMNTLLSDVDIYDNNIMLFTNQFLSPISSLAPTFYEFFLGDTVSGPNGQRLVRLNFIPRNPDDLLFRGMLYITLDSNYAVEKVALTISKKANLNFIKNLHIAQDFQKTPNGHFYRVKSDASADFSISSRSKGIHGRKYVSYNHLVTGQPIPDSVWNKTSPEQVPDISHRHEPLSPGESRVYGNIDSLRHLKTFIRTKDIINLFVAGYKKAGIFEIGPANTFYSFNPIEGFRLAFGGRSTPLLSNRIWLDGYGAYGFGDQRWKYKAGVAWSFNRLSDYGYPLHYLKASFQHDVKIPGQELQFVQDNSFLLSFSRGKNDKWLYNDIFRLDYLHELPNHLSYGFGFKYWAQQPAGSIQYIQKNTNGLDTIGNITTSQLSGQIRWAPHEKFYQGRVYRIPYPNQYPIFSLQYIAGIKGLFNSQYTYNNINLSIFKRFYMSTFGYTDLSLSGTYITGKLPFPLLGIIPANQTYVYLPNSYNLMNFLEFVSDHYAGVDLEHHFNGFIFNKVPFLKKLKWREIITGKILYGGLRAENDPAKDPGNVKFPLLDGQLSTFALGNQPYVEAGFAIGNIFKLVRVDAIERFSYLDHPLVPKYGIRFQVKFDY